METYVLIYTSTGNRCNHCIHGLATGLSLCDRVAHSNRIPLTLDRAFVIQVCSLQISVVSRNFHLKGRYAPGSPDKWSIDKLFGVRSERYAHWAPQSLANNCTYFPTVSPRLTDLSLLRVQSLTVVITDRSTAPRSDQVGGNILPPHLKTLRTPEFV